MRALVEFFPMRFSRTAPTLCSTAWTSAVSRGSVLGKPGALTAIGHRRLQYVPYRRDQVSDTRSMRTAIKKRSPLRTSQLAETIEKLFFFCNICSIKSTELFCLPALQGVVLDFDFTYRFGPLGVLYVEPRSDVVIKCISPMKLMPTLNYTVLDEHNPVFIIEAGTCG